jgi:hypothetical protein
LYIIITKIIRAYPVLRLRLIRDTLAALLGQPNFYSIEASHGLPGGNTISQKLAAEELQLVGMDAK